MRSYLLSLVHEGYMGFTKMKATPREYVFWPGKSKNIEEFGRRCESCTRYQRNCDKKPLIAVTNQVTAPWKKIGVELTGPSGELDNFDNYYRLFRLIPFGYQNTTFYFYEYY